MKLANINLSCLLPFLMFHLQIYLINCDNPKNGSKASNLTENQYIDELTTADELVQNDMIDINPCSAISCGAGKECYIDESTGNGKCECIRECGQEVDPRRKVCSNHNETYGSDCAVHQLRCFCEEGIENNNCRNPEKYKHTHIEYFGECRLIEECHPDELVDFPRRMREWLYNVMQELSERKEISYYYQKMEKEAEENLDKRWSNAAIWKWCDLDKRKSDTVSLKNNTTEKDNAVSRHELFPVRAPLQAMEHCIGKFLDQCDPDGNHLIELKEWGQCLEIPEEEMIQKCEAILEN